jgi:amino acid adenylation domain-containing protein
MSSTLQNGIDLSAEEKRALLADLLRERAARAKTVPTSFAQQRLWFLSRLEPDSPAYNIPRPLRMQGALNVPVLRQTFNLILARHDVLRGRFELVDGQPVQLIAPRLELDLPIVDLEHLAAAEREAEISRQAIAEAQRPFDLTQAPLLRVRLLRLAAEDHVLFLTMHHIVSDGWSMGLLVREMTQIYQALGTGQQIQLPELPIQYADFARWQRQRLQGEVLDEQVEYWKESLAGAPAVLDLPVIRARPATQTTRGSHLETVLSRELTQALGELSRREGVTLFMTLLAAFQTLLYRYSGQEDLVIGSPIAGRNRAEVEGLIGFFVNSLPLRTSLAGNPSFRELLTRVKATALGAYAHQDLPFEKIVEAVKPPRSLSYPPIFQIMFSLQNQPAVTLVLPGLKITSPKREFDTAKFDLTWFMTERDQGLSSWIEYNTDLFDRSTIERLAGHFEVLLTGIVEGPGQRIAELPLLTVAEKQSLSQWNETQVEFPTHPCVHQLFEEQVARTPDSTAVVFEEMKITYAELNRRANQLAHYLRKRGVRPEVLVGLCVERSIDMVVGILGILKAGGAYVTLDPANPPERLSFMLADAAAPLLLTQEHLLAGLPAQVTEIICLDRDWGVIAQEKVEEPASQVVAENPAYVIYTSGSTGRPKGVVITHRALCNHMYWMQSRFPLTGSDRVLQKTPIGFDASVWEFYAPLLTGAQLIMAKPDGHRDAAYLVEAIKGNGVTVLQLVPSLLRFLLNEPEFQSCTSLRRVYCGGEQLPLELVQQFHSRLGAELVNLYGPTEATIDSTYWICSRGQLSEPVPIGVPVANMRAYILDSSLEMVPVGVAGELYLGGAGLGRGYLNRPDLTGASLIPDRFSAQPGQRLYKTGDLARYREDGNIEYLRRVDYQLKLRGFRIELGEIAAVISAHPRVREAVVIVREGQAGDQRLVAYLLTETASEVTVSDLRVYLGDRLPEYMVPSYFVFLEAWPLTPSGKIDRLALPPPDRTRPDLAQSRSAPRNQAEERLAGIWKEVLELDQVGVTDNFFELGGHSLLAVRLLSEIEKAFGQKIPLVSLFRSTTIESLATLLSQEVDSTSWPTLVEIQKGDATLPLFCVSMPNVNALGYIALARYLGADRTVYGLQAQYPEDLQGEHSQTAVEKLTDEYLQAIRGVQPHGPYQFVGMCRGAHIAFEMARGMLQQGEEVSFVGILDTWVLENTYNKFLYVEYYARRLRSSLRLGFKDQVNFIKKQPRELSETEPKRDAPTNGTKALANPMNAYFPGPNFRPKTYAGRVSVFRTRTQPLNRIRDKTLGWRKLALGGVDLHFVPGKHGASVLREPHVQVLANEIKKCLMADQ